MLNIAKLFLLVVVLNINTALAQSCNGSQIPYDFLFKDIGSLVSEFTEIAENRNFENESLDGSDVVLLLIIWKGEYFLDLLVSDNVVDEIRVKDPSLKTHRCIRVGNKFSEVVKAYPEAIFKNIYDFSFTRDDGVNISFGFDTDTLPEDDNLPINKQRKFKITDPEVQELVLSVIRIYPAKK